ncbi:MAG: hypothetical protein J6C98_02505 [Oscillospiraceae bacterium]|nr:hypothetical protein [Oscillospiraceae bacterium]
MEQFREKLKLENRITAVLCVILMVFSVLGFAAEAGLVELTPVTGDGRWQSMWRGMVSGASFGVLVLMVIGLIRSIRALKDEKKLKKLYIEANDERQIQIWTNARATSMQVTLLLGLVAGLVIGYFHMAIGVTILAVESIHAFIGFAFKIYYSKKL